MLCKGKRTTRARAWKYGKIRAVRVLALLLLLPLASPGATLSLPALPVPYSWLTRYGLGVAEGDFETAANAPSGKSGGDGRAMCVWQDYVAGTDPTNAASLFSAKIEMRGGGPVVTWTPDLNKNGVVRESRVYGKERLSAPAGIGLKLISGETCMDSGGMKFFSMHFLKTFSTFMIFSGSTSSV